MEELDIEEQLTQREHEVLLLMAEGLNNKKISDKLVIAVGTVKRHINSIYSKLRLTGDEAARVQAVLVALKARII